MKEFKVINGFSRYAVSSDGEIKRLQTLSYQFQPSCGKEVEVTLPEKILKPNFSQRYKTVVLLSDGGKRKTMLVHRAVALVWVENTENKPYVNHIDGNRENNYHSNLEWCTQQENVIHSWSNGLSNVSEAQRENGRRMIKINGKGIRE